MGFWKRVLLHICCAPCASSCIEKLHKDGYTVTGYFYNPNIEPVTEYNKRLKEVMRLQEMMGFELYSTPSSCKESQWLEAIKGLEDEAEGGLRCEVCYRLRLEDTAATAKKSGIEYFTSTLSVSPHKCFGKIKKIGEEVARDQNISFLPYDFKKEDGFKRTIQLSKRYAFYRQLYCGCAFR